MKQLGLTEDDLKISRGSDPRKVSLAWAIARSTTVSQRWIANRLTMRSAANVSQQIRRFEAKLESQSDPQTRSWLKTCQKLLTDLNGAKLSWLCDDCDFE